MNFILTYIQNKISKNYNFVPQMIQARNLDGIDRLKNSINDYKRNGFPIWMKLLV